MKTSEDSFDLIVIGGGASGLMAAGRAAELGKKVLILEKNKKLGEKLKITGGGRCNITNAEFDTRALLKHYGKAEQFLYSLFSTFGVKDTFTFFETRGLPIVTEERNRAFPKTQKAEDVFKVLLAYIQKGGVAVKTQSPVTKITKGKEGIVSVTAGGEVYTAKNYLFATGSMSHPETGSTGDGFKWLRDLGHTVQKPSPTIVPLSTKEEWGKKLSGVTLSGVKIHFFAGEKKAFALSGKILFTHFGISGPLILNNAHKVSDLLHEGIVTARIDLYPQTDLGTLEKKILSIFDANKNKVFKNILKDIVPLGTAKGISLLLPDILDEEKKVHSISKEERKSFVRLLKSLPLSITGLMGFDRAVVADGGVVLSEIDMKTMRSLAIPNLFITGDLLHINRPSGGFSLQLCWSTGFVAGGTIGGE